MKLQPLAACWLLFVAHSVLAQDQTSPAQESVALPALEAVKTAGALRSTYLHQLPRTSAPQAPQANLKAFREEIEPLLKQACADCHGPESQEGNLQLDKLNPNLLQGADANWWLEVLAVLSTGEMPPADAEKLADKDRSRVIEWLTTEIQVASVVRRANEGHSSFRRMTRYEYNHTLQDLLGLPYDFARDLPPEPVSEDGFQNSSEMLHMSATQFETYRELGHRALSLATVRGNQPTPLYWGVSMQAAAEELWAKFAEDLEKIRQRHPNNPAQQTRELEQETAKYLGKPNTAHYKNLSTGLSVRTTWRYVGAKYAWKPTTTQPEVPPVSDQVAVIPPNQKLIVELGDRIPETGTLRVRVRASRTSSENHYIPSLQLEFGWQASNDSQASVKISDHDLAIHAALDEPQFYQWEIPLSEIYPRNSVRHISKLGDLPSPSEYLRFVNSSVSPADIQLDYVEITAPVYEQWPPKSHARIFIPSQHQHNETLYAREILSQWMFRAEGCDKPDKMVKS